MDLLLSNKEPDEVCIISGGAKGADTVAEKYANAMGYEIDIYQPDYDQFGKGAPLVRNKEMAGDADAVVAFMLKPGTSGTEHMIKHSRDLGKRVQVYMV